MLGLIDSFGLNGWEVDQTFRKSLAYNWGRVKGDFTGKDAAAVNLAARSAAIKGQVEGVHGNMKKLWKKTPDYAKIGGWFKI